MPKQDIPGEGKFITCLQIPGVDKAKFIRRHSNPWKAKEHVDGLNAKLAREVPRGGREPVTFFFVHCDNSSTLPWIDAADDESRASLACCECHRRRPYRLNLCCHCYAIPSLRADARRSRRKRSGYTAAPSPR